MNNNDYTVLLMLKDRFPFTARWLSYVAEIKFPYKIFIADGSSDNAVKDYLNANADLFDNLDIDYVKYPHDVNYSIYYKKIADALGRIKTKYVSVSDNDDFYIIDGIAKSIEFLKSHDDFASCRGEISSLVIRTFNRKQEFEFLYGKCGDIVYKYYYGESIELEKSSDRILWHANRYDPTFYDIHRTNHLKKCFERLRDINPDNIYLAEFLTSYLTVAAGKIKRLPCLYYVRQINAPGSSNEAETKNYDFFERMLLPSWSHDYINIAESVSRMMSEKDGIDEDAAKSIFMRAYKIHVTANIIWSMKRHINIKKTPITIKALNKLIRINAVISNSFLWKRIFDRFGISKEYFKSLEPIADFLRKGKNDNI